MLNFMAENKRILNLHEQKFFELVVFQANTNVFQVNTNAYLKNLETQVGQLSLNLQNQSKDSFPSDTKKNPKDCMTITLRSDKEVQVRKEVEKKQNDDKAKKEDQNQADSEQLKVQTELSTADTMQKKKEEVNLSTSKSIPSKTEAVKTR